MREEPNCEKLLKQLKLKDFVLNGMNIDIYVSDMSSHEILYTNIWTRQNGDDDPLTGRICWEALKDRSTRCESCPITFLLKNPGKINWQELRHERGRLLIYDNIIPWLDGKLAHLHYALDITQ